MINENIESEINIKQIAKRLSDLQDIVEKTDGEMADALGVTADEYKKYKNGGRDFSYTFLFKASKFLGVDVVDIMTGSTPKLSTYSITRAGDGLPIQRREGFTYKTVAYNFKDKIFNPLTVFAPYNEKSLENIELSTHAGHEFDLVLSGSLKMCVNGHTETLNAGDSIYYNASNPHGMAAINKEGCQFLAVLSYM
ncbi:MAG: XRE family transcriptional regulator [Oscillospiraceae bacterium]|nr:XRE family transcriptional regulator [Oscillospiraceae bacterium]